MPIRARRANYLKIGKVTMEKNTGKNIVHKTAQPKPARETIPRNPATHRISKINKPKPTTTYSVKVLREDYLLHCGFNDIQATNKGDAFGVSDAANRDLSFGERDGVGINVKNLEYHKRYERGQGGGSFEEVHGGS